MEYVHPLQFDFLTRLFNVCDARVRAENTHSKEICVFTCLWRCAALSLFVMLGACASARPQDPAAFEAALQAAVQQAGQGQVEPAVASLRELALRNPTRVEPWAYIAKIRYDEKDYVSAIAAAEKALSRDAADNGVKVILANAAMHVAAHGIEEIKGNALLAETTRTQAQALAQSLRKVYGDDELFPVKRKPKRNTRPAAPKPVEPGQNLSGLPLPPGPSGGGSEAAGSNPFSGLMH
jgi:tetratricopeptide (TPR) repeat protein